MEDQPPTTLAVKEQVDDDTATRGQFKEESERADPVYYMYQNPALWPRVATTGVPPTIYGDQTRRSEDGLTVQQPEVENQSWTVLSRDNRDNSFLTTGAQQDQVQPQFIQSQQYQYYRHHEKQRGPWAASMDRAMESPRAVPSERVGWSHQQTRPWTETGSQDWYDTGSTHWESRYAVATSTYTQSEHCRHHEMQPHQTLEVPRPRRRMGPRMPTDGGQGVPSIPCTVPVPGKPRAKVARRQAPICYKTQTTQDDGSNKGASKQRRDQINGEIGVMRDLLPLPESARQRLSQLQIMSLSCVYIRKCNLLQKLLQNSRCTIDIPCDFSQALTGFMLVTTRDGKLVYISENVTEYLGHSMVDMKTQGDSLFDIVDKRDHGTVQAQLLHGATGEPQSDKQTSFFCRMNMSRTLKRQGGFGDVKVMHVKGHFVPLPGQESGADQQVFMALCTPLITPDVKESLIQNNTMVFKSVHKLDMSILEITDNGTFHLGMPNAEAHGTSWYSMLHPEDIQEARAKHLQLIKSRHEMGCMMTVRMLTTTGEVIWVNVVMHVRQALVPNSDDPVIVCINQVVSEEEAKQFKIQGQLFALYASRAPDFFFGAQHFPSLMPGMEPEMVTQGPQHAFMPPTGYYQEAQRYNVFAHQQAQPQGPPIHHQPPAQYGTTHAPSGPGLCAQRTQGHSSTLKALKRKLQENFVASCRPLKVPRVMPEDMSGGEGCGEFYGDGRQVVMNINGYRNMQERFSVYGEAPEGGVVNGCPVQVAYQTNYSNSQILVNKKDVLLSPPTAAVVAPRFPSPVSTVEQVVPEVSIPECYLTPEPSPVSSPKPETLTLARPEVQQIKHLTSFVMDRLNELKENQTLPEVPAKKEIEKSQKKKVLPVIDATFVDSFFDDLDCPESEALLKVIKSEPLSPPPAPSTDCALSPPALPKTPFIKEEEMISPLEGCSDLAELFGFFDPAGSDRLQSDSFSPDCRTSPVQSPMSSCGSSCGSPSTPEHHQSDESLSTSLSPGSSPGYECRDDLLDPNSWLLEPMELPPLPLPPRMEAAPQMKQGQDELYQLKQLLSSWTPCGVPESCKHTQ